MTREMIIREFENRGYKVIEREVLKKKTIDVLYWIAPVKPVNYDITRLFDFGEIIQENKGSSAKKIVDEILESFKTINTGEPMDIYECIHNRRFVLNHMFIGLERKNAFSEIDYLKKEYEYYKEIEEYLYIRVEFLNIKVSESLLQASGIHVDEAWKQAEKNTCDECKDIEIFENDDKVKITNKCEFLGASQILNGKALQKIKNHFDVEHLVILPISIHECYVIPKTEETNIERLSARVKAVNEGEEIEETLADEAFVI